MIDVLKRLAELDANNSNVVYETKVSECGPMAMGGMEMPVVEEPKTPATLNITAGDGEELGNMLAAIMQLAGCLLYTSPSPRDRTRSRMPSSA